MQKLLLKTIILFIGLFIADKSYSQLTVTASVGGNVYCHGFSNGSATAHASGGNSPYSYLWNPSGQTHQSAINLNAGNYTVTVTDAIGATATATVAITEPANLSGTISTTPTSCSLNNGTATVNSYGGVAPYAYHWNIGQTTQTATGLALGTYIVSITDANSCASSPISVIITTTLSVSLTLKKDTANPLLWYGHDTIIHGTAPFTYLWNFGDGDTSTLVYPTHTYSVSGHYAICLTVKDANGCIGSTCDSTYKLFSSGIIKYLDILKSLNAGIENLQNANAFSIYPNPTNGIFSIQSSESISAIEIVNLVREKVYSSKIISDKAEIDLSNQPNGIYFLNIKTEQGIARKKLIINK